jgi:lysophospholipid acyltransferase (LPLAT)-like uncharacterized protein
MKRVLTQFAGLLGAAAVRRWMGTLDYKAAYYDPAVDPVKPGYDGLKLYIFWHEYLLFPLYLRGHSNLTMLLSMHRDADVLACIARHMGFGSIRGSSTRGGVKAMRELMRISRRVNLCATPDGPQGPRRQLAQGPIYLASRLGLPLVVMGFGYDRPWRMKTWDQFAIPRPGSRARIIPSPEINIPRDLDRDGIEQHRLRIETLLNRLTLEAEAWAESGTRKVEEEPIRRERAPRRLPQVSMMPSLHRPSQSQISLPPAA